MSTAITPEELYQTYQEKVSRYISSHVQNAHDREDILQQVFLNVIASLDDYDPARSAPGTWIYTITRNAVIDYYRKKDRDSVLTDLDEAAAVSTQEDDRLLTQEMLETLADALEQLSERERRIVIFRFYHGLSAQETALRVGVSYANVRYLQYNALKKMRRYLDMAEQQ